jgi:hypothetical protein
MLINSLVRVRFPSHLIHYEKILTLCQTESGSSEMYNEVNSKDWRPKPLRGWVLALLLISLGSILVTLSILFSVFRDSGVSQTSLASNSHSNNDNSALTALAPYSIIPTLIAVGIKIWWDSIDQTFRRLQPHVSMAQGPTSNSRGIDLSYVNSSILWIVGKAVSNRHFLLALITTGAVVSEICE